VILIYCILLYNMHKFYFLHGESTLINVKMLYRAYKKVI